MAKDTDQTINVAAKEAAEDAELARGLAARDVGKNKDAPAKDPTAVATPAPADKAADNPADESEVRLLRKKLAEMEAKEDAVQAKREAMDAVENLIRDETARRNYPRDFYRKLLPVTNDEKSLRDSLRQINTWVQAIIEAEARRGTIQIKSVGGGGGEAITPAAFGGDVSATALIASGLSRRY
jgi:hypothetical protein